MGHNSDGMLALMQLSAGNAAEFKRLALAAKRFALKPIDSESFPQDTFGQETNWREILRSSTWEHFDFRNIEAQHVFWPEGTSLQLLKNHLEETLAQRNELPNAGPFQIYARLKSIGKVLIEGEITAARTLRIHGFHPVPGPGAISMNQEELVAIAKVLRVRYSLANAV